MGRDGKDNTLLEMNGVISSEKFGSGDDSSVGKMGSSIPKISVVVPVYNTEKYLQECVDSILAQSTKNFELILVDDGSPDKAGEICDELAKGDSRIRVFHQENGGVTSARGFGVERARGEWITFVDSDDLLPKDALKDLLDEATDDTDWVQGGILHFRDGETPGTELRTGNVKSFDQCGIAEIMLLRHPGPGRKLVRKSLFSPYVFEISREVKFGEDIIMNLRLIANKPRNSKEIDKVVYCHRDASTNSVSSSVILSENYVLRISDLFFAELKKITGSGKKRVERALSRLLYGYVGGLVWHGLPIKFPSRLATLIRHGLKPRVWDLFIYFCLRFNYSGILSSVVKLRGGGSAKNKIILE